MGNGPLQFCDAPGQFASHGDDPLLQAMTMCGDPGFDQYHDTIFREHELQMDGVGGINGNSRRKLRPVPEEPSAMKLEALVRQLFNLQDLNSDGVLAEVDLNQLNERISRLRQNRNIAPYHPKPFGANSAAMRMKGQALMRDKLDAFGRPVPYSTFRKYVLKILQEIDPDETAQEIILQQFIAELSSARNGPVLRFPSNGMAVAQAPYMPVSTRRVGFFPVTAPCRIGYGFSDLRLQQMVAL
mmetsp:Transcript_29062/g.46222  ORF Transcript_29062/g.46222 Transcript_29062/m.46222 type:complete len:242 (-) Transcript_29062:34-759(-)